MTLFLIGLIFVCLFSSVVVSASIVSPRFTSLIRGRLAGLVFAWLVQCGYLIVLTVNSSDASDGSLTHD